MYLECHNTKNNTIMLDFHDYTGYWKIEKGNY
jgi:hypothetical protein